MTLEDLANLGEFIAALAVIVSLVYLAMQIRQAKSQMEQANAIARADAYREFSRDWGAVLIEVSKDPDLYRIWRAALNTGDELSDEDSDRMGMLLFQIFGTLNAGFNSSWLDESIEEYVQTIVDFHIRIPHIQGWWSRHAFNQPKPFRDYVNSRLSSIKD